MRNRFVRCVAVVVFAAAVQGWRFYKELYPYPIMFTTKIESEEDYDLLDGPASVMISDDMFRGPKGILNKMALFFFQPNDFCSRDDCTKQVEDFY